MMETVRSLPPEEAIDFMVAWFHKHYEDPVHSMPWHEGGYVWMVEECSATDELTDAFMWTPKDLITKAVAIIENDGWDWVRISDLDKMSD